MCVTTVIAMPSIQLPRPGNTPIPPNFTPGEAARLTGVSTDLQRDWRRRGLLAPKALAGHSRFEFDGLCRMLALKAFSDAGVRLKALTDSTFDDADTAASVALLPMQMFAGCRVGTTDTSHRIGRYVIIDGFGVCRADSLDDYEKARADRKMDDPVAVIFDCKRATESLLARMDDMAGTVTEQQRKGETR